VDANIIVSALLKNSLTRRILLTQSRFDLYSPFYLKKELFKYLPVFAKKLNRPVEHIEYELSELLELSELKLINPIVYQSCFEEAIALSPDAGDVPYLALALKLGCPLWSQDKRLKQQTAVSVYSTSEMLLLVK